jgi:hypothetical protein
MRLCLQVAQCQLIVDKYNLIVSRTGPLHATEINLIPITVRSRILLENPVVSSLVKKFTHFMQPDYSLLQYLTVGNLSQMNPSRP